MAIEACFSCGGKFDGGDGPTHKYMLSSPGCWLSYGDILAREYENPELFGAVHRLTVDAYALQHPGDAGDRRAIQSVWVHYAALHLAFECERPHAEIPAIMQKLASGSFPPLPVSPTNYDITLADVVAGSIDHHESLVRKWARCAFDAWRELDQPVRNMLDRAGV